MFVLWLLLGCWIGYFIGLLQPHILRERRRRRYRRAYSVALLEQRTAAFRHHDDVEHIRYRLSR